MFYLFFLFFAFIRDIIEKQLHKKSYLNVSVTITIYK